MLLDSAAYYSDRADKCAGAFYGGNGNAVAANLLFILAVIGWVGATCMTLFMAIKFTVGMRVSKEMEVQHYHTIQNRMHLGTRHCTTVSFLLFFGCRRFAFQQVLLLLYSVCFGGGRAR